MTHFTLTPSTRLTPLARLAPLTPLPSIAVMIALGMLTGNSFAQNAVQAMPSHMSANSLSVGTTTTESVLKQTLPAVNMMPGTPSDPNPRVGEPKRYADLQARITGFKPQNCLEEYHRAKAQAWHNFSRDQYHEKAWQKDIQTTTFDESNRIMTALEAKKDPGMDTPLVSNAQKLRPDLWAMADAAKAKINAQGTACCPSTLNTAFCEVQLVWSGHALANLGGWKRANGHVRMAEDLCQEAQATVCAAPVPTAVPVTPLLAKVIEKPLDKPVEKLLPPVAATVVPPTSVSLKAIALFYYDKHTAADLLPESKAKLQAFAQQFKGLKVDTIVLTGYADITNSTGDSAYNQKLSRKRANTVQAYLSGLGVVINDQGVQHRSDNNPVQTSCEIPKGSNGVLIGQAKKAALQTYQDCLQPNRRVEVEVTGVRAK